MCAKRKLFRIIYYPSGVVVELQYFMCQLVACDSSIKQKKTKKGKVVHYGAFVLLSFFPDTSTEYFNLFFLSLKEQIRLKVIVGIVKGLSTTLVHIKLYIAP